LLYLEGLAALWWQVYKRRCATVDWGAFATVVTLEFGTEEFGAQMQSCCNCVKQVLTEYRMAFEECVYHVLSLDESLNTNFFVTQFVLGLKNELWTAVRLQDPTSVTRVVALARIQEEGLENHGPGARQLGGNTLPPQLHLHLLQIMEFSDRIGPRQ
jgi:hypothetical protein